jgi:heat-inducible transcriptional repressor
MTELDQRKQILLQAIIRSYVKSAEPVGSEWLAANQNLGVSSATIRNELYEMTELGYLRQPHASAGRMPSDRGYRYYVDRLMTPARLTPDQVRALREAASLSDVDVKLLLTQTCRVLSSLTHYTSLASPPVSEESVIRQIHAVQVGATRLLLVIVLQGGQIIHRFVETPEAVTPAEVAQISSIIHGMLIGKQEPISAGAVEMRPGDRAFETVVHALVSAAQRALQVEEPELYTGGTSHMLGQPEFRESQKVEPLIRLLEERKTAFESLRVLLSQNSLAVVIGGENMRSELQECSLVAARYEAGPRSSGWVGVLGPTRMPYERTLSVVRGAAKALSQVFARLDVT